MSEGCLTRAEHIFSIEVVKELASIGKFPEKADLSIFREMLCFCVSLYLAETKSADSNQIAREMKLRTDLHQRAQVSGRI